MPVLNEALRFSLSMVPTVFPGLPPPADPNLLEFCKNLLFATHHKECNSTSELLQKVVALKCIQDNIMISSIQRAINAQLAQSSRVAQLDESEPCSSNSLPESTPMEVDAPENPEEPPRFTDAPVFFNSMTAVLFNLGNAGVDPVVAENIALDRLSSPQANPLSFMSRMIMNGVDIVPIDEVTLSFVKGHLKKLHDHESFSRDGAPYPFDVKSALRFSEHLHSQVPQLEAINPPRVAHEQSITFSAMARFMAMHEVNIELQILFPVQSHMLDEHAYFSALFWTYREAFKSFHYPKMPAPLPQPFQLTPVERQILCRYWNAGNRHVTATESILLSRRCPSLAPFQVYGFFDKRRRREYNKYRGMKDEETLALETTQVWRKLKEMKQKSEEEDSDDDDDISDFPHQREHLTKLEKARLDFLWDCGHRHPSKNECELLAADLDICSGEQIHHYFEDRCWHEEFKIRKNNAALQKK